MDFKTATDVLFEGASHSELAAAMGVSVASIRQARLEPNAKAHRNPPAGWAEGVKSLAKRELERLQGLLNELDGSVETERAGSPARSLSAKRAKDDHLSVASGAKPSARASERGRQP